MSTQVPRRELILNTFFMRFGHHPAAWRHPSATGDGRPDVDYWTRLAVLAERAKLHTFFLADFIGRSADDLDAQSHAGVAFQFEPISLLSHIAAQTKHIGLVATVNTNFEHPYNVARMFASLDHVSGGRAGWNVVSSLSEATAKNFGLDQLPSHADRYERASEFVALAKKLWDSWDDQAFDRPGSRERPVFRDRRRASGAPSRQMVRVRGAAGHRAPHPGLSGAGAGGQLGHGSGIRGGDRRDDLRVGAVAGRGAGLLPRRQGADGPLRPRA